MNLSHFSHKPIMAVRDEPVQDGLGAGVGKPRGLWVSVDGEYDWPSWCADQGGDPGWLAPLRYRVTLSAAANVLVLKDAGAIRTLTYDYGVETEFRHAQISWERIARRYDGIIIAPYCWDMRLDFEHLWYYGWDCASGCIWNAQAIASIELADVPRLAGIINNKAGST